MEKFANVVAITSTGLLAGAFAYAFFSIVPTFSEVPLEVHFTFRDALMRHNGVYVQIVMALSVLTPLWSAYTIRVSDSRRSLAILASLLAATSFVVTRFGNVPINQLIKTWSVENLPANWKALLHTWDRFNLVRSLSALGCFVSFIAATLVSRPYK